MPSSNKATPSHNFERTGRKRRLPPRTSVSYTHQQPINDERLPAPGQYSTRTGGQNSTRADTMNSADAHILFHQHHR